MTMTDSVSIIGGADGPTAVYVAGTVGRNWINMFGLIFVILFLIPNIIYAIQMKKKNRKIVNQCPVKWLNILEGIGRYGCMILMVFSIGMREFGFESVTAFLIYLLGNSVLTVAYWTVWMLYFVKPTEVKQVVRGALATALFLLSGITLKYVLLVIFAVLFGVTHFYVVKKNQEQF